VSLVEDRFSDIIINQPPPPPPFNLPPSALPNSALVD